MLPCAYECLEQGFGCGTHTFERFEEVLVDGPAAATAWEDATSTIPIVFMLAVYSVAEGLLKKLGASWRRSDRPTMAAGYGLPVNRFSPEGYLSAPFQPAVRYLEIRQILLHMGYLRENGTHCSGAWG